ncbi:MAG: MBL fold metallo-hydrolase [Ruminococcus sp.]|nr:MBL fold metallo-hydrolase [Ruminococcus sp.]
MARLVPLFSGSKGNCYYIGTAAEGVLIDAGRNCKQIELAMEANGLSMSSVAAVLVTHEHIDHCAALKVLTKKHRLPVYASAGTLRELERHDRLAPTAVTRVIERSVTLGNLCAERVNTLHDAAESCCYRVTAPDGKTAMVATDLGVVTEEIREALTGCQAIVLESNHDVEMLRTGPYPYPLKKRILSDHGHLSNDVCAAELTRLVRTGTLRLVLGHLSEMNNTPHIALRTSVAELERAGMKYKNDYTLDVASAAPSVKSVIF